MQITSLQRGIDPIKTNFADFEAASKNKEIDYKAVYLQMISEG